jgi:DNA polymerase-3 subunit epsilon
VIQLDFVAIDFETANAKRSSPCSLALTVVEKDQVTDQLYSLLDPQTYFDSRNIKIHGITAADTQDAPTLADLWPHIAYFFQPGKLVAAHNARFDCSVLQNTLERYHLPRANFAVIDSLQTSRKLLKGFENYRLNTVCEKLNIQLEHHHNALDDSLACANILLWQQKHFGKSCLFPFVKNIE